MRLYQMFNGFSTSLLEEEPIIEAKNGAEACKKLLEKLGIKYTKIIRSKSNSVKIRATPIKYDNGLKYLDGLPSWFEIY